MKFSERVYFRKMYFSFPMPDGPALREVYASLIKGKKNILIDCGVSYNYADIEQLCAEAGLKVKDIDVVINTHYHPDHIGGNFRIKSEKPEIEFWAHSEGRQMIEDIDAQFKVRPVPAFYHIIGGSVKIDRFLEDGEEIDLGFPVQVLHTPGHSPDSISLYLPEEGLLIIGDSLPYFEDIPIYDNLEALENSLQKMEALKPKYILSSFCGLWDMEKDGDMFKKVSEYLKNIQGYVNTFIKKFPEGKPEELGQYVLDMLGSKSKVLSIFLRSLKEHTDRAQA